MKMLEKLESSVYFASVLLILWRLYTSLEFFFVVYLLCQLSTLIFCNLTTKITNNSVYRIGADSGILNGLLVPLAVITDLTSSSPDTVSERWEKDSVVIIIVTSFTLLLTDPKTTPLVGRSWLQGLTTLTAIPLLKTFGTDEVVLLAGITIISWFINYKIPSVLPRCFTYGELLNLSQILVLVTWRILHALLLNQDTPYFSPDDIFCSVGVTGLLVAVLLCYLLNTSIYSIIFYVVYILITVAFIIPVLYYYLQEFPIIWLIKYMFNSWFRVLLLIYWMVCSVVTGCIVGYYNSSGEVKGHLSTIVRKYFHVVVVIVYIPGLLVDVRFLYLSSVVALAFFVILETVRVCNIPPLGDIINQSFTLFIDDRDQGIIVLTHLYLLIGLSLPLWITKSFTQGCVIKLYSGVLSLGVGDTVASIIGSQVGSIKWPGTKKTVEGTCSSILAQCITIYIFYLLDLFVVERVWICVIAVILSSLLEAFTSQIDNLVLPIFTYSLLALA